MKSKKTHSEFCFKVSGEFKQDEFTLKTHVLGLKDLSPEQFRTFLMAYMEFQSEHIFPEILRRGIPGLDMTGQDVLDSLGLGEKEDAEKSLH